MGDIAQDIKSKFPNNKVKALLNILYTANWISSKQNAFFKPFGLSPQQYNVLRILKGGGKPLMMQTIKDRMIERSPNTSRMMDKLYAKDLIERIACAHDRRVVHIQITDKGLKLLDEIALEMKDDHLQNLNEQEAEQLSELLDKIR